MLQRGLALACTNLAKGHLVHGYKGSVTQSLKSYTGENGRMMTSDTMDMASTMAG